MKYGRFTRLAGLFGLVLLSGFSRTDFEDDDLLKERILYSDLVVRGVITDIETGLVTMDNWLSAVSCQHESDSFEAKIDGHSEV
jgi:hypothetical protein